MILDMGTISNYYLMVWNNSELVDIIEYNLSGKDGNEQK